MLILGILSLVIAVVAYWYNVNTPLQTGPLPLIAGVVGLVLVGVWVGSWVG